MIITFITSFNLADKKVRITDTTNYAGVTAEGIFGNVTARIGNTIFYQNTNFDSSADIVIGNNSYVEFDLPLNADGTVRQTTYSFEYEVKILDETIGIADAVAPATGIFSSLVFSPAVPSLITEISALISTGTDCRALFFGVNPVNGVQILSTTGIDTINFAETTDEDYFDIDTVTILSTSFSSLTNIYDFCDKSPKADLCVTSDCYFATLEAIDSTPYLSIQTIVDRVLTINWPRLANGNAVQPPTITDQASQVVGPNLYTGDFLVTLSTDITWTQIDGLVITNTIAARSDFNVTCDGGICEAYACIKAYAVQYQEAVAQGSRQIAQFQQQNFQILIYCNLYNLAVECQQTVEARAILVALSEYMNTNGVTVMGCSCGCGNAANNSTEPTVIYPLYSTTTYNDATELARGIIQLATQAETDAGIDDTKAITPLKLANYIGFLLPIASQTIAGIIEIATQLETNSGLDNTKAITPLTLSENIVTRIAGQATAESAATGSPVTSINNVSLLTARGWRYAWDKALTLVWSFTEKISFLKGVNISSPIAPTNPGDIAYYDDNLYAEVGTGNVRLINTNDNASEIAKGIAEIATQAEVTTGTDDTRFVTPLKLKTGIANTTATTTTAGVAQLASQAESEAAATAVIGSINNTKITTPRGWRWAWDKAITLAWDITGKFNFKSGINLQSSIVPSSNGDMVYFSDNFYGQVEGVFSQIITNKDTASETVKGISEIATQVETDAGSDNTRFVTPLKLQNKIFNDANIVTGTDTATLNTINGTIDFSTPIAGGLPKQYTLNNNKITTSSVVLWSIQYNNLSDEQVYPLNYNLGSNIINFWVGITNGTDSETSIRINFTILNP
jgi:hypothetical protein